MNSSEAMAEFNYFNYFTEIEEYFWQKRGAHLLVSPLDWAIVETWQKSGIPLPAVLRGIDRAFESYARSRRAAGGRQLKSLAYCVDAVLDAAEEEKETAAGAGPSVAKKQAAETFSQEDLRSFFGRNVERISTAVLALRTTQPELATRMEETRSRLDEMLPLIDTPGAMDLEDLERRLTVLDDKISALLMTHATDDLMLRIRREVDGQLSAYRRKMKAEQLALVEKKYTQKRLLEEFGLPRLSLYYFS